MADQTPMFSIGFPPNAPTPQEQAGLSTQIAIAKGSADGIKQVAVNAVDQALAGPMVLADQLVDSMVQPVHERMSVATQIAGGLASTGQQAAVNALQAPLRAGIALGYTPQNASLLAQSTQAKRQRSRRKSNAAKQNAPQSALPISKPPSLANPPPAGSSSAGALLVYLGPPGPGLPSAAANGPCPQPPGPGGWESPFLCAGPNGPGLYMWQPGSTIPIGPGGGAVGPTLPAPPGGNGVFPIGPAQPPPPKPIGPPIPPPASPCPCPNINITIPITPPPPPNVTIYVPPCPNCGQIQSYISVPTPAQNITINAPPCPTCQQAGPQIYITVPSVLSPASGGGATPTTGPSAPPPSPAAAPSGECPTCSIPYLCLHFPQFVLASKAARKTDYDILVDSINLGLCCGNPEKPAVSMPLLQREYPDFVAAAKAQGLSDDETMQQAVNVGLYADVAVSTGLGESAVGYIAPGSAAALEAEFDPQQSGEASTSPATRMDWPGAADLLSALGGSALAGLLSSSVVTAPLGATTPALSIITAGPESKDLDKPPPPLFRIGNVAQAVQKELPEVTQCLGGLARPVAGAIQLIIDQLTRECNAANGSFVVALTKVSADLIRQNSIWSRAAGGSLRFIASLIRSGACTERDIAGILNTLTGCQPEIGIPAMIAQGVAQVIDRWLPLIPGPILESLVQLTRWSCPITPPSSAEANGLYAAGWIDKDTWECIVRTNGQRPDLQKPIVDAQRRRPSDLDLLLLYRKGALSTKELAKYWGHNGWTDGDAFDAWRASQEWVASPSDVINYMIKDVADPQITETFLTKAEFNQKYQGGVKDRFNWNGISKDDALMLWQSHWRNMAPTQLYELHKRLRPGWTKRYSDAEALAFAQAICPRRGDAVTGEVAAERPISNGWPVPTYCDEVSSPGQARAWMESLVTDGYHVSEALGQADYPAFWRQRLLALSYRVLNRTDLGTAYVQGSITPARLLDGLLDLGYINSDALALQRQDTFKAILRFARNPACTQFIRWGGDLGLVEITLLSEGMAVWMWPFVQYLILLRRLLRVEQQFLKALQAQYMKGLVNDDKAQKALQGYNRNSPKPPNALAGFPQLAQLPGKLEDQAIKTLLDEWKLLKQATPKQETAAQICQEFKTGLITGKQALAALTGLGYTSQTAQKILSLCYLRKLPSTLQTMPAPGTAAYAQMQQALDS